MKSLNQLHAGAKAHGNRGGSVWHSRDFDHKAPCSTKGVLYWSGDWSDRTPEELLVECQSTIVDLMNNHPELKLPAEGKIASVKPKEPK